MYPYNEDAAWTRVKDLQREMENGRVWGERTGDLLSLLARPLIGLVEMAMLAFRPLPAFDADAHDNGERVTKPAA